MMLEQLIALRKDIHRNPELSSFEVNTSKKMQAYILDNSDFEIISNLGGHSFVALHTFGEGGKTIGIRCELDALPIQEVNQLEYASCVEGVSHKCGHDGHMTMVAGLVHLLPDLPIKKGRVILNFQSAEETGLGAKEILSDPRFGQMDINAIYSLHNIPGFPMNAVINSGKSFTATVQSVAFKVKGKITHAALPEKGINPTFAINRIIGFFEAAENQNEAAADFYLATPIYSNIGEQNYGTAAAYGEIHYTIRCWSDEQMDKRVTEIEQMVKDLSSQFKVSIELDYFDYYPASQNDAHCCELMEQLKHFSSFQHFEQEFPFRFGEDFGWYSKEYPCLMFGLGSGKDTPALHNDDYDFPDEILETGMNVFVELIKAELLPAK